MEPKEIARLVVKARTNSEEKNFQKLIKHSKEVYKDNLCLNKEETQT